MSDKNCFCFTCMEPVNLNGMVCERCFGSDWQCPDENDKDALREWLDPWHPAGEPPEKEAEEYMSRNVLYCDGEYIFEAYYSFMNSAWKTPDSEKIISGPNDKGRDLPPMPEKGIET